MQNSDRRVVWEGEYLSSPFTTNLIGGTALRVRVVAGRRPDQVFPELFDKDAMGDGRWIKAEDELGTQILMRGVFHLADKAVPLPPHLGDVVKTACGRMGIVSLCKGMEVTS